MAFNQYSGFTPSSAPKPSFFKGAPAGTERLALGTGQQQGINSQLGNLLQGSLGNTNLPGGQNSMSSFAPIAQNAQRNFQTQTVPGLAERFTSLGGGQLGSPAFANMLGQAGAGLQSDLASQEQGFNMQQEDMQNQNLMRFLQMFLQPQFENLQHGQQSSGLSNLFSQIGGPLAQAGLAYGSGGLSALGGMGAGMASNAMSPGRGGWNNPYMNQNNF